MRLFLSSYRAGSHSAELLKLVGSIRKVAIISNAKDYKNSDERAKSMQENFDFWRSIGIEPTEIDLRPYFHKDGAAKLLNDFEFVWLAGGNAFLLRRALKYSGMDKYLIEKVRSGALIYGGESAGAIMAAPSLRGSEDASSPDHEDDPDYTPDPYEREVLWGGLGLIDFVLVPHYKNPNIGDSIDGYVDYLRENNIDFDTIREEEAYIVNGDKTEFIR
ncbi:MAG TPA: Type 1 glutamine amidotransferase-like domain-containing protein [Candidatus Saccharimonadales bacterium]|nr:Type 1 glutamine amidotransferase-like domain-containing protein [Candidatus Saccharimonadales bacterium]